MSRLSQARAKAQSRRAVRGDMSRIGAISSSVRHIAHGNRLARIRRTMTRRLERNEQARFYHWKSRNRLAPKRVQQTE